MGVSKNRGTPKWMVFMETPIKMDDWQVPLFSETSIYPQIGKRQQIAINGVLLKIYA